MPGRADPDLWSIQPGEVPEAAERAVLRAAVKRALPWWSRVLGTRRAQGVFDALRLRSV